MRKDNSPGLIMLEENFQKLPDKVKDKHKYKKPNVAFKMSEETFDKINKGEIGGFAAFLQGKLKTDGNLMTALKFDSNVLRRYNPDESYTKKTPSNQAEEFLKNRNK